MLFTVADRQHFEHEIQRVGRMLDQVHEQTNKKEAVNLFGKIIQSSN